LPSAAALGTAGLVVTTPLLLGLLQLSSRHQREPPEPTIALRRVLGVRAVLGWAAIIILGAVAAAVVAAPLNAWLDRTLFATWPASWKPQLGLAGGYSDAALLGTALLLFLGSVCSTAVVEEAYFRGFLLPRMPSRFGRAAPVVHTVLFALYHVWSLWLTPSRILGVLPLTYISLRTRSILPAIVAHVVLNFIDVATILVSVIMRPD
jgi:uncharacterized protein